MNKNHETQRHEIGNNNRDAQAIYMTEKNDISCVIDMQLNLYEHQSTVNPNIPLRDLDYVARTYSLFYRDEDIYSPHIIRLSNPKFIIFYNGLDKQPARREMRLSDATDRSSHAGGK